MRGRQSREKTGKTARKGRPVAGRRGKARHKVRAAFFQPHIPTSGSVSPLKLLNYSLPVSYFCHCKAVHFVVIKHR